MRITGCRATVISSQYALGKASDKLTTKWVLEKFIDGTTGTENACTNACPTMEFMKDDSVTQSGVSWAGAKWQLSSDKEKLEIVVTVGSVTTTYSTTILRLTSKEVWFKDDDGDQTHYKAE